MKKFQLNIVEYVDVVFRTILIKVYNKMILLIKPEKPKSYGELNRDKTFYVITDLPGGLASQYNVALNYIYRAEKKGYIPIIDLENAENDRLKDDEIIERNPWEYYFEQPVSSLGKRYTLDEIYKSKRVIQSCSTLHMAEHKINKNNIHLKYLISKKIKIKESEFNFMTEVYNNMFEYIKGDIVGAYYRGTDYKSVGKWKPVGHAKVPSIEVFCDALEQNMKKWECKNLFFMTEEQEALDYVIKRFPQVHYVKKERFNSFSYGISVSKQVLPNTSKFTNNRLYLSDIFMLSKCQYLIGTFNNGLQMAMIWNDNKYKDYIILDYGITGRS